jgi:hypothetical protein
MSDEWRPGPFTRAQGKANGVTSRMLQGSRYERVHPRVWKPTDHVMTEEDWLVAAKLALPAGVHLTGITRLQQLGLDYGPRRPLRFVVDRDVHRVVEGIFLHRTKKLPPLDDVGVCIEAAYISYCSRCRVIDAIKVGHLDPSSRSLKESEVRGILEFAGLPRPDCNVELGLSEDVRVIGDLVYRRWRTVVEYEGEQHQDDRDQYSSDIDRYELFRDHDVSYVQVTKERLGKPRELVLKVDHALRRKGYDGAAPLFGERWRQLFGSLYSAVGPRDHQRVAG